MGKKLIGNIHYLIIVYALYGLFNDHQAGVAKIEEEKNKTGLIEVKIKKARKKIKKMNEFEEDLVKTRERVEDIQNQIKKAQRQLPNQTSDTVILNTFKTSAEGINIKDVFLQPGQESEKGFYFAKAYQFKGTGTWLQFLIFYETLLKNERLFNVKNLKVSRAEKGQRGQFQFVTVESTMEAFRYNPNFKAESEVKKIEKKPAPKRRRKRRRKST